jgi:hypothetical protein
MAEVRRRQSLGPQQVRGLRRQQEGRLHPALQIRLSRTGFLGNEFANFASEIVKAGSFLSARKNIFLSLKRRRFCTF